MSPIFYIEPVFLLCSSISVFFFRDVQIPKVNLGLGNKQRSKTMQAKKSKMFVYVKQFRRSHHLDRTQFAIMVGFLLISTLASLWLPFFIANLVIKGF